MQALAVLCLALGTGSGALETGSDAVSRESPGMNHSLLLAQLRWLTATDTEEASTALFSQHTHTAAHHAQQTHTVAQHAHQTHLAAQPICPKKPRRGSAYTMFAEKADQGCLCILHGHSAGWVAQFEWSAQCAAT